MFAFQSLHPRQFVVTNDPLTLLSQFLSLLIQGVDGLTFGLKLLIPLRGQPITDQMRFEIGLFLKDDWRDGVKFAQPSRV